MNNVHVYSNWCQHSDAWIAGEEEGLRALRDAIDKALASGTVATAVEAQANDGESYNLFVVKLPPETFGTLSPTYQDPTARTESPTYRHPFECIPRELYIKLSK